jgi:hypothetical protein
MRATIGDAGVLVHDLGENIVQLRISTAIL